MRRNSTLLTSVALAAVTALLGACSDGGAGNDDTADEAPSSSPTATTTTAETSAPAEEVDLPDGVLALPGPDEGADFASLDAGRYRIPLDDTLSFDVDVPDKTSAHDDGLFISTGPVVLKVAIADETYGVPHDACTAHALDPAGPGVDDLARAIHDQPVYHASPLEPVQIGDAKGTYTEVRIPRTNDADGCQDGKVASPGIPATSYAWEPPFRANYAILDVDGRRVVVAQECTCSEAKLDEAAEIARSITFTAMP